MNPKVMKVINVIAEDSRQFFKHSVRVTLGRSDPEWDFRRFENKVHKHTWEQHNQILQWAEDASRSHCEFETRTRYERSDDPIVRQGYALARDARDRFCGSLRSFSHLRFLIQVPPPTLAIAGTSLFTNLIMALNHMGLQARELPWGSNTSDALDEFRPNVLMTGDHERYLSMIDWRAVARYRKGNCLLIGSTPGELPLGQTAIDNGCNGCQRRWIGFYYVFSCEKYAHDRYADYFKRGNKVFSIEFGANPIIYYPIPDVVRDLNYVFLASRNPDKWERYYSFLKPVLSRFPGFISGPGWRRLTRWTANALRDRYLYSRAKVGLNLHLQSQVDHPSELNERTYMLAACGVPQLVDSAALLSKRFDPNGFFIARDPAEYLRLMNHILQNPKDAQQRALLAQLEVFSKHTIFHRSEKFVNELLPSLDRIEPRSNPL